MVRFICTRCRNYYKTYREAESCCPTVQVWDDGYPIALDKLALCPNCGKPWPETETIRTDGSLGCPCQEPR